MKKKHLYKKRKKILTILTISVGVGFVLYGVLSVIMYQSTHPTKFTKFKPSVHYRSTNPSHGTTITALQPVAIDFDYPVTTLSTVSMTAGDWEDGVGPMVLNNDRRTISRQLHSDASDAIYTVNYTACFIDNICDYGYFQFRLRRAPH